MAPTLVLTFLLALAIGLVSLSFVSRRSHHHYSPVAEALVPPLMFYNLWILLRLFVRFVDSGAFGTLPPTLGRTALTGLVLVALLVALQLVSTYLAFAIRASYPEAPELLLRRAQKALSFLSLGTSALCLILFTLHRDPWFRLFGRGMVTLCFLTLAGVSLWIWWRAHQNKAEPYRRNLEILGTAHFLLFSALALFILFYRISGTVPRSTYDLITVGMEIIFNLVTILWIQFFDRGPEAPAPATPKALDAPGTPVAATDQAPAASLLEAYGISKREEEVILLVCQGRTNQEIADALFISLKTVKDHNYKIFQKTGVRNRVELAQLVQRWATEGERGPDFATPLPHPLPQ